MDKEKISILVEKWMNGTITEAEKESFALAAGGEGGAVLSALEEYLEKSVLAVAYDGQKWDPVLHKILTADKLKDIPEKKPAKLFSINIRRIAAAAAIISILFMGSWLFFRKAEPVAGPAEPQAAASDILAPGVAKATLRLANGQVIYLDSAESGSLAMQGQVSVVKLADGQIAYGGGNGGDELTYNTISNPRGSKVISITLLDGTGVWLNAASSLTYPASMAGNVRTVEITGEAYFEVAQNKERPFLVKKGETEVTVLGTHFNVNAYDDEEAIKVTLLEGSVKVGNSAGAVFIKPGQQAQLIPNTKPLTLNRVDISSIIAWKAGWFEFSNSTLPVIMRQLSRWYDIDVSYEGQPGSEIFGGRISKDLPLSNILRSLEANGARFRKEGRRVIVLK